MHIQLFNCFCLVSSGLWRHYQPRSWTMSPVVRQI